MSEFPGRALKAYGLDVNAPIIDLLNFNKVIKPFDFIQKVLENGHFLTVLAYSEGLYIFF